MGGDGTVPCAKSYDAALTALGNLISGKKRSGGDTWQHAYDGMRVFLEARLVECCKPLFVLYVA